MSFDWENYLSFSKEILDTKGLKSSDETIARVAISRAYYACHWSGRLLLEAENKMEKGKNYPQIHSEVIKRFNSYKNPDYSGIGKELKRLCDWRTKSDYRDKALITRKNADMNLLRANKIIKTVNRLSK